MSFLSAMLPTIVGAGVGMFAGPWAGAAAAGLLGYSKNQNLGEGLMAGLAGYGGASLTQGLNPAALTSEGGSTMANAATAANSTPIPEGALPSWQQGTNGLLSGAAKTTPSWVGAPASISETLANNATFGNVSMAASPLFTQGMFGQRAAVGEIGDTDLGPRYVFDPGTATPQPGASGTGMENEYFPGQRYTRVYNGPDIYGFADGGDVQFPYGESVMRMARGGLSDLGSYSDGGRLLRGPGDGVSDSIPAVIGRKQPARLADGEFVVPARIVSELGNGSTEAGARQLYKMMDRVQKSRAKTTGKGKIAKNTNAARYLPA